MSVFVSVIILILVALIFCFLQITPGVFTQFYHYSLGRFTKNRTDDLSLDFILGVETFSTIIWFAVYTIVFMILYYNQNQINSLLFWILASICIIEALFVLIFYFKKGHSTATFIPRSASKAFLTDIKKVKSRKDAFAIGFLSAIPELIITLPLYIMTTIILANSVILYPALIIILLIIVPTIQLFIIRLCYRSGHNLASIQRFRTKTKLFLRLFLSLCFLELSAVMIYLGVLYNG